MERSFWERLKMDQARRVAWCGLEGGSEAPRMVRLESVSASFLVLGVKETGAEGEREKRELRKVSWDFWTPGIWELWESRRRERAAQRRSA